MTKLERAIRISPLLALLLLGACVTVPSGPSTMALPGTGKNFEQFRHDDFECRQYAQGQVGGSSANAAAQDSGIRSATVGTLIGAAAGAAINGGHGAGVGAATGLAVGSLAGTSSAQASAYSLQQRYDIGYTQCMYAKGHKVQANTAYMGQRRHYGSYQPSYVQPQPPVAIQPPPPPPGTPPAPPPM